MGSCCMSLFCPPRLLHVAALGSFTCMGLATVPHRCLAWSSARWATGGGLPHFAVPITPSIPLSKLPEVCSSWQYTMNSVRKAGLRGLATIAVCIRLIRPCLFSGFTSINTKISYGVTEQNGASDFERQAMTSPSGGKTNMARCKLGVSTV